MKRKRRPLTPAERQAYQNVTENARDSAEVFLRCANCGRSMLEGYGERAHRTPRSRGGQTTEENLDLLCNYCHRTEDHNERINPDSIGMYGRVAVEGVSND